MPPLPQLFLERLKLILPEQCFDVTINGFAQNKFPSVRVNTLKKDRQEAIALLRESKIAFDKVSWYQDALIVQEEHKNALWQSDLIKEGIVYSQSLSSMLPPLILAPEPGERVLDLCCAPGSKMTQMAAQMNNEGEIVCVENIKKRFYKLKSVAQIMGVQNAQFKLMDGRKIRENSVGSRGLFDKILVDVPCSSEGRFKKADKKSTAYWSLRKIKEMVHKQKGLLLNASRLLKPDGVLVYSTCTFAPEENEGVIDWLLKKTAGALIVELITMKSVEHYPAVMQWNKKTYNEQVARCFRVLPDDTMEGFFMAKLKKVNGA